MSPHKHTHTHKLELRFKGTSLLRFSLRIAPQVLLGRGEKNMICRHKMYKQKNNPNILHQIYIATICIFFLQKYINVYDNWYNFTQVSTTLNNSKYMACHTVSIKVHGF